MHTAAFKGSFISNKNAPGLSMVFKEFAFFWAHLDSRFHWKTEFLSEEREPKILSGYNEEN